MARRSLAERRPGRPDREPIWEIARAGLHTWAWMWFRKDVAGTESIPREGPVILAFNHVAYLDALAALYLADKAKRRARFLAKAELFDDRRLSFLLRSTKMIPVRRSSPDAGEALQHALTALRAGECLAVFPEGSAAVGDARRVRPLKSGAARLALATGAPIIPAAMWGTQNVWPKDAPKRWWPGQMIVGRVGAPIWPAGDANSPRDVMALNEELRAKLQELVDQVAALTPVYG